MSSFEPKKKELNGIQSIISRSIQNIGLELIDPKIACIQILQYSTENRSNREAERTIPWLAKLQDLILYLTLNYSDDLQIKDLLISLGLILHYQSYKKNIVIKRFGEKNNHFFLIMDGSVHSFQPVFQKECLTIDEYLVHLLKLELLGEKELVHKIKSINQETFHINCSVKDFCKNNSSYNYRNIYKDAIGELTQKCHINIHKYNSISLNPEEYIAATTLNENRLSKQKGVTFYNKLFVLIPKYHKCGTFKTGQYIGNLILKTKNLIDDFTYISAEQSGIAIINKTEYSDANFFSILPQLFQRVFFNIQTSYYIFQNVPKNIFSKKYSGIISFKTYNKGDKIFYQSTINKGVYLLIDGEVEIFSRSNFDELDSILISLQHALDGFTELYSKISQVKVPIQSLDSLIKNPIYQRDEFHKISREKRRVSHCRVKNHAVLGLNECYDSKTELYHFECECQTQVHCFEISREYFNYIVQSEPSVFENVTHLIENRVKYYIHSIARYKENVVTNLRDILEAKGITGLRLRNNFRDSAPVSGNRYEKNYNYANRTTSNIFGKTFTVLSTSTRIDTSPSPIKHRNAPYKIHSRPQKLFINSLGSSNLLKEKDIYNPRMNRTAQKPFRIFKKSGTKENSDENNPIIKVKPKQRTKSFNGLPIITKGVNKSSKNLSRMILNI